MLLYLWGRYVQQDGGAQQLVLPVVQHAVLVGPVGGAQMVLQNAVLVQQGSGNTSTIRKNQIKL